MESSVVTKCCFGENVLLWSFSETSSDAIVGGYSIYSHAVSKHTLPKNMKCVWQLFMFFTVKAITLFNYGLNFYPISASIVIFHLATTFSEYRFWRSLLVTFFHRKTKKFLFAKVIYFNFLFFLGSNNLTFYSLMNRHHTFLSISSWITRQKTLPGKMVSQLYLHTQIRHQLDFQF